MTYNEGDRVLVRDWFDKETWRPGTVDGMLTTGTGLESLLVCLDGNNQLVTVQSRHYAARVRRVQCPE